MPHSSRSHASRAARSRTLFSLVCLRITRSVASSMWTRFWARSASAAVRGAKGAMAELKQLAKIKSQGKYLNLVPRCTFLLLGGLLGSPGEVLLKIQGGPARKIQQSPMRRMTREIGWKAKIQAWAASAYPGMKGSQLGRMSRWMPWEASAGRRMTRKAVRRIQFAVGRVANFQCNSRISEHSRKSSNLNLDGSLRSCSRVGSSATLSFVGA